MGLFLTLVEILEVAIKASKAQELSPGARKLTTKFTLGRSISFSKIFMAADDWPNQTHRDRE